VTLGRTPLGRAGSGTTVALLVASNIPDIDIVAAAHSATEYLHWHRGPTHGPLAIVGLGLPAAGAAWLWNRFQEERVGATLQPPAAFTHLLLISMLGVALHIAMDFPTSYRTRVLSPFDWGWYGLDWMPIIDIYMWVALGAGLLLAGAAPERRRRAAAIVLMLIALNYAVRGVAHHRALVMAPQVFGGDSALETAAIPTFGSPAAWTIVTRVAHGYELHELNVLAPPSAATSRTRRYFPNEWTPAVWKASETRLGQIYLGFSRFPAARSFVDSDGSTIVRWNDMRFVTRPLPTNQQTEPTAFSAVVRLDSSGNVIEERFGPSASTAGRAR
jgi:hypothetical protein